MASNHFMGRVAGHLRVGLFWLAFAGLPAVALAQLTPLEDTNLSEITGQALLVSDKIPAASISNSPAIDSNLTFYRMGLDATVAFNANIDRLRLGCGGINDFLDTGCDIDMSYVRFMGNNGSGGAGAAVTSDFTLTRPYIQLAIANDGSANREVVGFALGSQSANGFVGIGRTYAQNAVNQESGATCSGTSGNGALACHSGLNQVSGFLNTEMSGTIPVSITLLGSQTACFGNTNLPAAGGQCTTPFYTQIKGTRINTITVPGIPLTLSAGFLSAIGISQAYATIQESLTFIHGFSLDNTNNFFLSFQRQQVAWPNYNYTTNDSYTGNGAAVTANTGWWMNVPKLAVTNIQGATVSLGFFQALSALASPGPTVTNSELNQSPPTNCYGNAKFC